MKYLKHARTATLLSMALSLVHCGGWGTRTADSKASVKGTAANFKLELTDAPLDGVQSVVVNIHHAELRVAKGGKEARVIVAENLGPIDLLQLRNGVTLPMANIQIPPGTVVTQILLVVNADGHYLGRSNESRCNLKTPSAQKTGIKMLIHQGLAIEGGYDYKVVADFDAEKSIVSLGNGGCLLKPVLKLKSATRSVQPEEPQEPQEPNQVALPATGDNSGSSDGFEDGVFEDPAPIVDLDELNQYML